jgi:altronate hydrolase
VASGAQLLLFTTGRGTPFGCLVPAVKIASHTDLFTRKSHWMDFDAGPVLLGAPMPDLASDLYRFILQVASGEAATKSEALDKRELSIFKDGIIL